MKTTKRIENVARMTPVGKIVRIQYSVVMDFLFEWRY